MNRWTVLVVTPSGVWPVELSSHRPSFVGRGRGVAVDLKNEGVSERHLSLTVRDESVLLEVVGGAGDVVVNDVPVVGHTTLRAGDEVRVGHARLVLSEVPALPPARPLLATFEELMSRLSSEVAREEPRRPVGVVAVAPPSLNVAARAALTRRVVEEVAHMGVVAVWGELAADVLMAIILDAGPERLGQLFAQLPGIAGPRAHVATATSVDHGLDAEALVGALWAGILGPAVDELEPIVEDPVMVRLLGVMEGLAESEDSVCVVGPSGSGRRTLLRRLLSTAGRTAVEVRGFDPPAVERALRRPDGWVLVHEADASAELLAGRARGRVLATCRAGLPGFEVVVPVPPLRARPRDILALAEAFLARARGILGRPRLHLGTDARGLLSAWAWPGEVRELKNVMLRAARAAVRDEVGRDSLPSWLSMAAGAEDLRGAMKAAERELLLEALARTRWNVTAAASRLGVPRRTVVYRMGKLGLKRPAR